MTALPLLVPVMLAAGIVGGLINWFIGSSINDAPLAWWKHVIIGVGAAFIVPVFLNMISSTLVSDITGELYDAKVVARLLVLAGFCLLAAIASRALLRSIGDRVLQDVRKAKKEAQSARQDAAEARAVVAPLIEDEFDQMLDGLEPSAGVSPEPEVSDEELKILKAMAASRFSVRSLGGLARDAGLARESVDSAIDVLLEKGLVSETRNKGGQPRWYPTVLGRSLTVDSA